MLTDYISFIDQQFIYVLLSAIVAILIWLEGNMLKKTKGKLPASKFFHISSVVDTVWFVVSMGVLYWLELSPMAFVVATAYGLYSVAGWIYGSKLLRQKGMPDDPKDLVIPLKYVAFSQSFALTFFFLCLFVLFTLYVPKI